MRVQHNESMPLSRKPPTKKGGKQDEPSETGLSSTAFFQEDVLDSSNAMYDPALLATGTPVPSAPIASGSATPRIAAPFPAPSNQPPSAEEEDLPDDPEVTQAIEANPQMPPDQVRYLCYLARHKYAAQEREGLQAELDQLESKKESIQQDKDTMLDTIFRREIGPEAESVIKPLRDEDIPALHWKLANRTSLPNIGIRDVKTTRYDDDEE